MRTSVVLPAPFGPEQGDDATFGHDEVDPAQGVRVAERRVIPSTSTIGFMCLPSSLQSCGVAVRVEALPFVEPFQRSDSISPASLLGEPRSASTRARSYPSRPGTGGARRYRMRADHERSASSSERRSCSAPTGLRAVRSPGRSGSPAHQRSPASNWGNSFAGVPISSAIQSTNSVRP